MTANTATPPMAASTIAITLRGALTAGSDTAARASTGARCLRSLTWWSVTFPSRTNSTTADHSPALPLP